MQTSVEQPAAVQRYKYLVHVVAALVFGVALILISIQVKQVPIASDVLDELGVATIVAAIVTLMYETYAREVLTQETMTKILETIMGDMFDGKLWEELRSQLLKKVAVRRAFAIRISLERDDDLQDNQAKLSVAVTYRLHVLRSRIKSVPIYHYLDRFMSHDKLGLPRFEFVSIGSEILDARRIGSEFRRDVPIPAGPEGVPINIERHEVVYTPGAYNLLMSDLTELETILIERLPDDVEVEVNWTLDDPHELAPYQGCLVNRMLLPGHSIEFRFHKKHHKTRRPRDAGAATDAA